MLGEGLQVMGPDEPFSIASFLSGHVLVYVLLVVVSRHVQGVRGCDVVVKKRIVFDDTELFVWVKVLSISRVSKELFEWSLLFLLTLFLSL